MSLEIERIRDEEMAKYSIVDCRTPAANKHIDRRKTSIALYVNKQWADYHDEIDAGGTLYRRFDYNLRLNKQNTIEILITQPFTQLQYSTLSRHLAKLVFFSKMAPVNIYEYKPFSFFFWREQPDVLDIDTLRKKVTRKIQILLLVKGFYHGKISGIWNAETAEAHSQYLNQLLKTIKKK